VSSRPLKTRLCHYANIPTKNRMISLGPLLSVRTCRACPLILTKSGLPPPPVPISYPKHQPHGCHRPLDRPTTMRTPHKAGDPESETPCHRRFDLDLPIPQSGTRQRGPCAPKRACGWVFSEGVQVALCGRQTGLCI
jgi:hypothetical protein